MADKTKTILESWPGIKKDLLEFLSDSDAWIITQLKEAHATKNNENLDKIIDIMNSIHNLSHHH
jgi:hypothetical protein